MALKIRKSIHSRERRPRCSTAKIRLRRPKRWWLDAAEFRELRRSCLLNQRACAEFLGIAERTVRNWDSGRARVPKVVIRLLRLRRNGELGDLEPAWDGWLLRGDRLISPEGREFRPREMSYWGNTAAMARLWRSERVAARLSAGMGIGAGVGVVDDGQGRMPAAVPVGTRPVQSNPPPLPCPAEPFFVSATPVGERSREARSALLLPGLVKLETSGGIEGENGSVVRAVEVTL